MANLINPRVDGRQEGDLIDVLHNGNKIYAGGAVVTGADGYAKAGAASLPFVGVAMESTPETPYIRVWSEGVFDFDCLAAVGVQANVGKRVVLTDDHTVALDTGAAGAVVVGQILGVNSTTSVRVRISTGNGANPDLS